MNYDIKACTARPQTEIEILVIGFIEDLKSSQLPPCAGWDRQTAAADNIDGARLVWNSGQSEERNPHGMFSSAKPDPGGMFLPINHRVKNGIGIGIQVIQADIDKVRLHESVVIEQQYVRRTSFKNPVRRLIACAHESPMREMAIFNERMAEYLRRWRCDGAIICDQDTEVPAVLAGECLQALTRVFPVPEHGN